MLIKSPLIRENLLRVTQNLNLLTLNKITTGCCQYQTNHYDKHFPKYLPTSGIIQITNFWWSLWKFVKMVYILHWMILYLHSNVDIFTTITIFSFQYVIAGTPRTIILQFMTPISITQYLCRLYHLQTDTIIIIITKQMWLITHTSPLPNF